MIRFIGYAVALRMIKFLVNQDLKIMDACEKTLDLSDVKDMEHAEFHARRRQQLGEILASWQDRRDRRTSAKA